MIDLKKAVLPSAVEVEGILYYVHTSFKYWIRFLELSSDKDATLADFDFMYSDQDNIPVDRIAGFKALTDFCNPPQELPRGSSGDEKAVDYAIDADYIFAAFLEQYGIDIVESDMHWYKFQSLFRGLHDTKLNEIIGYRLWESDGRKPDRYTRQMEKLRAAWELPVDDSGDDEALAEFENWLNGGKG